MGRFLGTVSLGCLLLAGIAPAQVAISARSGLMNYVEGTVILDGTRVTLKPGSFPQMQNGSELWTEQGRAEVLLAPGVFMRLGGNSAVRLLSGDIMDTRVEFLGGSVLVETADMAKQQGLTFSMNGALFGLLNRGVYRLDSGPPQISVYAGEAWVTVRGQAQLLKRGRRLRLDRVAVAERFDTKTGDDFFLWAAQRAGYLAAANVSAAASAQANGFLSTNMWIWEPLYDTYTFLPAYGFYNSFWGCRFYPPGGTWQPVHPPNGPIHFNRARPVTRAAGRSPGARRVERPRPATPAGAATRAPRGARVDRPSPEAVAAPVTPVADAAAVGAATPAAATAVVAIQAAVVVVATAVAAARAAAAVAPVAVTAAESQPRQRPASGASGSAIDWNRIRRMVS